MGNGKLEGRAAIVTGAGRPGGLGEAIALELAAEGANVAVVDVCKEDSKQWSEKFGQWADLQKVAQRISDTGRKGLAIKADLTNEDDVIAMTQKAMAEFGRIDILVNNAGGGRGAGPIEQVNVVDIKLEDWRYTVDVNLTTAFLCCKHAGREMIKAGRGAIVNFSSIAGRRASPGGSGYCAGKAGVIALTRNLAFELAPYNIRTNCIAPGVFDTPWVQQRVSNQATITGADTKTTFAGWTAANPMKRAGESVEMATVVAFLASDAASYLNGQTIGVDGGLFPN
jgi:NAD(P)-dependent dehydrogenase (short-subunit alcohol dehydrogenase family)